MDILIGNDNKRYLSQFWGTKANVLEFRETTANANQVTNQVSNLTIGPVIIVCCMMTRACCFTRVICSYVWTVMKWYAYDMICECYAICDEMICWDIICLTMSSWHDMWTLWYMIWHDRCIIWYDMLGDMISYDMVYV